jgi:hypothetical protein
MNACTILWRAALVLPLAAQAGEVTPGERDPMQPPPAVQAAARPAAALAASAVAGDLTPRHVMTLDGKRYLIDRGRRLGVGDMLGEARIERIDDGAVWLREGGALQQISLFGGIVKRAAVAADAAASHPALPASRAPSRPTHQPSSPSDVAAANLAATHPVSSITPNR